MSISLDSSEPIHPEAQGLHGRLNRHSTLTASTTKPGKQQNKQKQTKT